VRKGKQEELERRLAEAQRRIAQLELDVEARTLRDPLTGLPTLQVFDRRLDKELGHAARHGTELSLAVLDVDAFRGINLRFGREVGDQVLQGVAKLLPKCTRSADYVTRSSADEFLVLMPETGAEAATETLAKLLVDLESMKVGPLDCVSASVGIAQHARPMSASDLVAAASERLEGVRVRGGGRAEARPVELAGDPIRESISGLAEALLERDSYTGEHSAQVAQLAGDVARSMGLDEREVERVRAAAQLHDIGKVGIPDDILRKRGELTDNEWNTMRAHPMIGERIVRSLPGLGPVARIIRHEHERWDGSGYPEGLSGEDIPIGARIVFACDAYHAMTSERPYRDAMTHANAIRELAEGAGSQFDPQVTEVLIGYLWGHRQMGASQGAAA
jgi:diguanylate cyclase (GGDEF)-like protein/putative nucleotidyltransferase with HDIG domain